MVKHIECCGATDGHVAALFIWQDEWNADWSGKLTPNAELLLSLFANQHNITEYQQAIV